MVEVGVGNRSAGATSMRSELEREQAYVSMLYARLDTLRERARRRLEAALGQDGGTRQALLERDALVASQSGRVAQLAAVEDGLCFGRLDRDDGSRMYVGRIGLFGEDGEALLVDWRAPAARPFYRATAAVPDGVVRRRHLRTRHRVVAGFEDDVLDLDALSDAERGDLSGEAALLAALTAGRTGRMRDIVATIQAEQDRVIRSGLPGVLVVQGGPGTGKTAVALHRAAYLLYTHRARLAGRGVLVVGPNPTFLSYIERVLPSLGETDVLLSTVDDLFPGGSATAGEAPAVAAVKGDLRMAAVLAAEVRDRQRIPGGPLEIPFEGDTLRLDVATCARARDLARASGAPHNQARAVFAGEIAAALARQVVDRLDESMHADELVDEGLFGDDELLDDRPLLDDEELAALRDALAAAPAVRAALERLWPELTPQRLVDDLLTSPERLAAAGALDPAERSLLLRPAAGGARRWTPADVPLLDEAAEVLGDGAGEDDADHAAAESAGRELAYASGVLAAVGVDEAILDPAVVAARYREPRAGQGIAAFARTDRTWSFGHVIVDEAQELSAMAWRMVVRRSPARSMTVVGDLAQRGSPWGGRSWAATLDPHVPGRWREERLSVNYRTPSEIMEVAADVLAAVDPGAEPPRSVRAAGTAPWHARVGRAELAGRLPGLVAAEAAAVGDGTLAVLVPASLAAELGASLVAAVPGAVAGADPSALDAPVAVLAVADAKGLEFDGVVVVEPAAILAESVRGGSDLYVALTRATQRLGVVHCGELPAMLGRLRRRP